MEVKVTAEDRAGNQGSHVKSVYIDNKAPRVEIKGAEDYLITSEPVFVIYEVYEENTLSECTASAEWQNVQGEQSVLPVPEWENAEGGKRTVQRLSEDGIYRLKVSGVDKAGYKADKNMQVIIDKENPVIGYVDRLEGKYMKSFCWDYPEREFVSDFTTVSSEVRLDGMLYPLGKNVTGTAGPSALWRAVRSPDSTPTAVQPTADTTTAAASATEAARRCNRSADTHHLKNGGMELCSMPLSHFTRNLVCSQGRFSVFQYS